MAMMSARGGSYTVGMGTEQVYVTQQVVDVTPPRTKSPGSSRQRQPSPLKPGQVQQAMTMVPTVHVQLNMMEDTIRMLSEENGKLKSKMLENRRGQLEKFFLCTGSALMQACFGEWERVYKELKAARDLDELNARTQMERGIFETNVGELQKRIKELADALNAARADVDQKRFRLNQLQAAIDGKERENQALAAKAGGLEQEWHEADEALARAKEEEALRQDQLRMAEDLIAKFLELATGYKYQTNPQHGALSVPPANQIQYLKDQLHSLLADVDTKYIAPVKGLNSLPNMPMALNVGPNPATAAAGVTMEAPVTMATATPPGMPGIGIMQKRTMGSIGNPAGQIQNLMMSPRR